MNNYYKTFQGVIESADQIMLDEGSSEELKQSATQLNKSVKPCITELKQSATKLKGLVKNCFNDLYHAEDVWHSKQRVIEVPTSQIWEQIGDWSGLSVKARNLYNQSKSETLKTVKKSWTARIERLKRQYFEDDKNKTKNSLNLFEKDKFIKDFDREIQLQINGMKTNLSETILLIIQGFQPQKPFIEICSSQLNAGKKSEVTNKFNSITESLATLLERSFGNGLYVYSVNNLIDSVSNTAKGLAKEGTLGISRDQFTKTYEEVAKKLEKIVVSIFDELSKLVTKAIEQAIAFYNDFLELQKRYQQETPEQRQAENAWIEQQRQELMEVENGIEIIIN
ncbi:hypothetical protein [Trichormus sp. NMC-1]|uniref:hypothetical protein n=1 Tax=Trichormus sp. NMC-1 TaxID=1853259 RepID=UPI0008DC2358|nr:hypothetical protein [Trichormus sp. NMC-1]